MTPPIEPREQLIARIKWIIWAIDCNNRGNDPHNETVGILTNPANPFFEAIAPAMRLTAQPLKLTLHQFGASGPVELKNAFAAMVAKHVGDATLIANGPTVAKLALQHRLPSSGWPDFASAGGLMAYGVDSDLFRRAATFVDKIFKGARPADLPVERSTKFEMIINLRTAKALCLSVPLPLIARADEIVE
jgi:putative tryptophan/tyrosine transport system substrate-binding protein